MVLFIISIVALCGIFYLSALNLEENYKEEIDNKKDADDNFVSFKFNHNAKWFKVIINKIPIEILLIV